MRLHRVFLVVFGLLASTQLAFGWGQEGHSIVAEIAQRRLTAQASAHVEAILGKGHSLASVASWADDVRDAHPDTYNWHFVDIPIGDKTYDAASECTPSPKGDCLVAALERLKIALRCGDAAAKLDALRFIVHLIGDLHQPLHTVADERGGNGIQVTVAFKGNTCTHNCEYKTNFHAVWDTVLIERTVWDWGAYVDRLEAGWLASPEGLDPANLAGTPTDWLLQTHLAAQQVWALKPESNVLDDNYYQQVLPVVDKQLGLGGLRLAAFLNDVFSTDVCTPADAPK